MQETDTYGMMNKQNFGSIIDQDAGDKVFKKRVGHRHGRRHGYPIRVRVGRDSYTKG